MLETLTRRALLIVNNIRARGNSLMWVGGGGPSCDWLGEGVKERRGEDEKRGGTDTYMQLIYHAKEANVGPKGSFFSGGGCLSGDELIHKAWPTDN